MWRRLRGRVRDSKLMHPWNAHSPISSMPSGMCNGPASPVGQARRVFPFRKSRNGPRVVKVRLPLVTSICWSAPQPSKMRNPIRRRLRGRLMDRRFSQPAKQASPISWMPSGIARVSRWTQSRKASDPRMYAGGGVFFFRVGEVGLLELALTEHRPPGVCGLRPDLFPNQPARARVGAPEGGRGPRDLGCARLSTLVSRRRVPAIMRCGRVSKFARA